MMPLVGFGVLIVVFLFMALVIFRLSVILPAPAIGKPLGLGEALGYTKGASWPILVVILLLTLCSFLAQMLALVPVVGVVLSLLLGMILPIINVSVLTTLYGVFVEKRTLS